MSKGLLISKIVLKFYSNFSYLLFAYTICIQSHVSNTNKTLKINTIIKLKVLINIAITLLNYVSGLAANYKSFKYKSFEKNI